MVGAIRTLAVRGAPLLGIAGAYGVALAVARGFDVEEAVEALAQARPTAVNLGYGVRRAAAAYRTAFGEGGAQAAAAAALVEARAVHAEDIEASTRMAEHGLALLGELLPGGGHRILTHCNTGALVSGGEGTALAVALAAHRAGELHAAVGGRDAAAVAGRAADRLRGGADGYGVHGALGRCGGVAVRRG